MPIATIFSSLLLLTSTMTETAPKMDGNGINSYV
jgi:hypothetical protein